MCKHKIPYIEVLLILLITVVMSYVYGGSFSVYVLVAGKTFYKKTNFVQKLKINSSFFEISKRLSGLRKIPYQIFQEKKS